MTRVLVSFLTIVLGLCFALFSPTISKAQVIVIDPGHGGVDGGATVNDVSEDTINLSIGLKLGDIFLNNGYQVIYTRDGDYDLATDPDNRKRTDIRNRVNLINNSNCLAFISIHLNKFSIEKYHGAQVFYGNPNPNSELLAHHIQKNLQVYLANTNREIVESADIFLLNNTIKVGCLVECGFLSNDIERGLLLTDSYQSKVAQAIFYGFQAYDLAL